jgi:hypothetical protein
VLRDNNNNFGPLTTSIPARFLRPVCRNSVVYLLNLEDMNWSSEENQCDFAVEQPNGLFPNQMRLLCQVLVC